MAWTQLSEPVKVKFGGDHDKALETYVHDHLDDLISSHRDLFTNKLPEWRRIYEGKPENEDKAWPWKNCSNLVIQIIGSYCDQLLARVLTAIHQTNPLWVMGLTGKWDEAERGEEKRIVVENYMNLIGQEPGHLDMYRNEYDLVHDAIKYGCSVLYIPFMEQWEEVVAGYEGTNLVSKKVKLYSGPKPSKLPYETFLMTPRAKTLEEAEFKAVIKRLTWFDIENCVYQEIYDKDLVEKNLKGRPDRTGADINERAKETNSTQTHGKSMATWDIYECWFPYIHNGKKYRLIYSYHHATKTTLRKIFNWYPDNEEPLVGARLGYEGDTFRGRGYVQLLKDYQAETSTQHNQSCDAGTLSNTSIYRVDPNSKLDANISIFPSAVLPLRKDELEVYQMGRQSGETIEMQRMTLELAKERAGVDPPTSGMGSGVTNPKKGGYSSMGTLAVLQEKNSRTNINITDFRYTHMKAGRFVLKLAAKFGPGVIAETFGEDQALLEEALKEVEKGRLNIPVKAATGSVNKEVAKQNDMLLMGVMKQHYQWVGSVLQTLPTAPEHMRDYILRSIQANDLLALHVLRNFEHEDASRFVPEARIVKEMLGKMNGQSANASATGTQGDAVQPANIQQPGGAPTLLPQQGGGAVNGVPA
jgi:hypothetical protein